jgi:hypothetical protein
MRRSAPVVFAVLAVLVLALSVAAAPTARAQTSSQVRAQIGEAYVAVLQAEQSGGNVTSMVAQLNSALSLVQQADSINGTDPSQAQALYSQASSIAGQVIQSAPAVASAGAAATSTAETYLAVETVVLAGLAVVAYLYTPRIFWSLWLRVHRGWRVKKA